jgi:hypothetical protein
MCPSGAIHRFGQCNEGARPRELFEQHGAQGKQVGRRVDRFAPNLFRRQIPCGPEDDADEQRKPIPLGIVRRKLGDAEIKDLRRARSRQGDVVRLQIATHQSCVVSGDKSPCDLDADSQDFIDRHRAAGDTRPQRARATLDRPRRATIRTSPYTVLTQTPAALAAYVAMFLRTLRSPDSTWTIMPQQSPTKTEKHVDECVDQERRCLRDTIRLSAARCGQRCVSDLPQ